MPFNYKIEAPVDKIKLVQAFKGRGMLGGLPTPKYLDDRGWLEWLKHDKSISGGNLLPSWLTYNEGKRLLTSSQGPLAEDAGIYTIRAYGHGEVILAEIKLNVGGQSGKSVEMFEI
jgi:hypothetical protein